MSLLPTSPLLAKLGTGSGRLAPANATPTDGSYVFVLGSDALGVFQPVTVGDFVEVANLGDLATNGYSYVRFKVHFRPPASMPAGVFWRFTLSAADNGNSVSPRVTYDLKGTNNHEVQRVDLAVPLKGLVSGTRQRLIAHLELAGTAGTYFVELPGVYVDSVLLDLAAARPTPINRIPEPGETGVKVDADIQVEINDPTSAALTPNIALTHTRIYVGGTLAYDGNAGGFQTGFTGPDSAVSTTLDGQRTAKITIDPLANFAPATTIPIRVISNYQASLSPDAEYDYSFTTEDLIAPTLVSASAVARRTVRVSASEALLAANAAGASDALNPANWALAVASTSLADGLPAVTPIVIGVVQIDNVTFDLTLDIESTRGALYRAVGGPLHDLVGNQMASPNNSALFSGYACTPPDGRDFALLDMLPSMNVNEDASGDLHAFIACLQEVTDQLLCDIDEWPDILDPDLAPERFVDAMLADLGNPFSFSLAEVDKRRLVRVLVPIYQQKGTDPGIINAVRFFVGLDVTISVPAFDATWTLGLSELAIGTWLGSSSIHDRLSFYVVSAIALTQAQRDKITSIVVYMKDARTHFLGIQEPSVPVLPDHLELGLSELGVTWILH